MTPLKEALMFGDIDLINLDPTNLRMNIGVVPQQPTLFSADVTHNISYGNPSASKKQIKQAAKEAFAFELH